MMLSNTCKYAIRAVVYLSLNVNGTEKIGIKQIAADLKIPTPFLGKILQVLAKNKILLSTKGPHGGFSFSPNSAEITLYDIIKLFDGEDFFHECLIGLEFCKCDMQKEKECPFHMKSGHIRDGLYDVLSNQKISELAKDLKQIGNDVVF